MILFILGISFQDEGSRPGLKENGFRKKVKVPD